jgi:RNA polymerase sigma factor (sigma-70 family)
VQPDARLVELARAGDERAFETLVRRYWRELSIHADRLLGAEGRSEDACQQALLQAWLALRSGDEVHEVRAWLYRIVHNCAVTTLRRARHETVELNEATDTADDDDPDARLVLGEIFERLSAMPAHQRHAIVMTAVSGRSQAETAAELGLSAGAVRGLIYRARAALRSAAAAFAPAGYVARLVGRHAPAAGDASEMAGAAGSAGIAATVVKGGVVLVAAGALAGTSQVLHGAGVGSRPHASAARHHTAIRRPPPDLSARVVRPRPSQPPAAADVTVPSRPGALSIQRTNSSSASAGLARRRSEHGVAGGSGSSSRDGGRVRSDPNSSGGRSDGRASGDGLPSGSGTRMSGAPNTGSGSSTDGATSSSTDGGSSSATNDGGSASTNGGSSSATDGGPGPSGSSSPSGSSDGGGGPGLDGGDVQATDGGATNATDGGGTNVIDGGGTNPTDGGGTNPTDGGGTNPTGGGGTNPTGGGGTNPAGGGGTTNGGGTNTDGAGTTTTNGGD